MWIGASMRVWLAFGAGWLNARRAGDQPARPSHNRLFGRLVQGGPDGAAAHAYAGLGNLEIVTHPGRIELPLASSTDGCLATRAGIGLSDWSQPQPGRRQVPEPSGVVAAVHVLNPDYVVLARVGADLHLDQLQRDLARVHQTVHAADRQVDRLVLVH